MLGLLPAMLDWYLRNALPMNLDIFCCRSGAKPGWLGKTQALTGAFLNPYPVIQCNPNIAHSLTQGVTTCFPPSLAKAKSPFRKPCASSWVWRLAKPWSLRSAPTPPASCCAQPPRRVNRTKKVLAWSRSAARMWLSIGTRPNCSSHEAGHLSSAPVYVSCFHIGDFQVY